MDQTERPTQREAPPRPDDVPSDIVRRFPPIDGLEPIGNIIPRVLAELMAGWEANAENGSLEESR